MSLYLSLIKDSGELIELNWLRNPFGLECWVESNTSIIVDGMSTESLYHVCNHWSYAKSKDVDRKLFIHVVDYYWNSIKKLDKGYFFFDLPSYIQFVQPHFNVLPIDDIFGTIHGCSYNENSSIIKIPMEHFNHIDFNLGIHNESVLGHYKNWFKKLVDFAEALQDESTIFECTN